MGELRMYLCGSDWAVVHTAMNLLFHKMMGILSSWITSRFWRDRMSLGLGS